MLITLKTYILTSKNAKMQTCKLQDSKIQSCKLQDSKIQSCKMQDQSCKMQDQTCKMQDQTCKLQDSKMQSIIDFKKLKFCCIILIFSAQFTCSGKIFFCTKLKILLNGKFQP